MSGEARDAIEAAARVADEVAETCLHLASRAPGTSSAQRRLAERDGAKACVAAIRNLPTPPVEPNEPTEERIDPRTGRPLGDYGKANEAIDFALDYNLCPEPEVFLRSWRQGSLDEWPEFYDYLVMRAARPTSGREGGE